MVGEGAEHPGSGQDRLPSGWRWAIAAVVALALILRISHLSIFDISRADELMQYLEQGNRMATGAGIIPWEWRFGLRNALLPQLLAAPLALGHALDPVGFTALWLARLLFAALLLIVLPAAWRLGALAGRPEAFLALVVVATWWESVLFSDLLLSESLGAALLLAGAALLLDPQISKRGLVLAGVLVGLSVLVRLQFAAFAAVLTIGALRFDLACWKPFLMGATAAAIVGALSDILAGLTPYSWIWVTFQMNIGDGRASRFGTAGPLAYLVMLRDHFWPFLPIVFLGAISAGERYRPLLYAALANLVVHSFVAHKEYRFIWVSVLSFLVLAGIGSGRLVQRFSHGRSTVQGAIAVALVALAWVGMSAVSAHLTGGIGAYRGGGAIPRLAEMAARDPKVCGIAVDYEYKAHIVPALLRRPLPLLLIPGEISRGGAPLPSSLSSAANALVLQHLPAGAQGFSLVACDELGDEKPCLFERPGTCAPAGPWSYQRMIEQNDL